MRGAAIVVGVAFTACSGSPPAPERTEPPPSEAPPAAGAPLRDESAPATRSFATGKHHSMYAGHWRASWPVGPPEPSWVRGSFANLALESFDGATMIGQVDFYAGPGLDAAKCSPEIVWDANAKRGVRLRNAPTIEKVSDEMGTHATWRFRSPATAYPAVKATAFVHCPNDVMFYSIEMIAPGPKMRDEYCKAVRRDSSALGVGTIGGKTFDLMFACGAMIRLRGRELVDECRGDTLLSLDALGSDVTAGALAAGTPLANDELRRWHSGSYGCVEVHLASATTFADIAKQPFAEFAKRAGDRLVSAFSRDGMIQR